MSQICRDDYEDACGLIEDLSKWIMDHVDGATPKKIAFLLVATGAEIATLHSLDSKEGFNLFIKEAVALGEEWAEGYKKAEN